MTTLTFSCFFVMKNIRRICFISTLSRCMVVIGLLLTLRTGVTQTEHTSKACFGVDGILCTSHHLHCTSGSIAVREAYYTTYTECPSGLSSCPVNFGNIPETRNHNEFNAAEWNLLQEICSALPRCEYRAKRRNNMNFSVVKYNCINNTVNVCNAIHHQQISDPALIWKGEKSTRQEGRTCFCSLYAIGNEVNVNITSLDTRMYNSQTVCMNIIIKTDDKVVDVNCSSRIRPSQLLAHALNVHHVVIGIPQPSINGQIWIQIQGSTQFSLHCQPSERSTTVTVDVNGMSSTLSPTDPQSSTGSSTTGRSDVNGMSSIRLPTEPQSSTGSTTLSIGSPFNTGALVGSLVACALIIAGVAFVTVLYLRKRKIQKAKKGGNTIPQTVSKETYSLANGIPENLYVELEKPPPVPEAVQYDYATADGLRIHNKDVSGEGDYDHTSAKQSPLTGDYDTAASVASKVGHTNKGTIRVQDGDVYSYDHLNGATDSANGDAADYDTTASSKKAVSKLNSKSLNVQGDDYSYSHLGSNPQVKTIQNDYDTTASAVKAVARLDETSAAEENDYDHVNGNNGYKAPASPYDTAGNVSDQRDDYNLAGKVTDPYDLAK